MTILFSVSLALWCFLADDRFVIIFCVPILSLQPLSLCQVHMSYVRVSHFLFYFDSLSLHVHYVQFCFVCLISLWLVWAVFVRLRAYILAHSFVLSLECFRSDCCLPHSPLWHISCCLVQWEPNGSSSVYSRKVKTEPHNEEESWCRWLWVQHGWWWDFPTQTFPWFTENGPKKRKRSVSSSSLRENAWCQRRMAELLWADRNSNSSLNKHI